MQHQLQRRHRRHFDQVALEALAHHEQAHGEQGGRRRRRAHDVAEGEQRRRNLDGEGRGEDAGDRRQHQRRADDAHQSVARDMQAMACRRQLGLDPQDVEAHDQRAVHDGQENGGQRRLPAEGGDGERNAHVAGVGEDRAHVLHREGRAARAEHKPPHGQRDQGARQQAEQIGAEIGPIEDLRQFDLGQRAEEQGGQGGEIHEAVQRLAAAGAEQAEPPAGIAGKDDGEDGKDDIDDGLHAAATLAEHSVGPERIRSTRLNFAGRFLAEPCHFRLRALSSESAGNSKDLRSEPPDDQPSRRPDLHHGHHVRRRP